MSRICPKPCSKLATSTVFITIGVVQLLVGLILLKSEYANLISGPDFMTASTNIGIGCVYGLLSTIWKNKKRKSSKYTARRNVLTSLLASIIAVNATTAVILVMGDGNALVLLHLENQGNPVSSSDDFVNEVLACAYVTSVCSPIVCIVMAIVAISGSCMQIYYDDTLDMNQKDSILKEKDNYKWMYVSKERTDSQAISIDSLSVDSRSSTSDDSVFSEPKSSESRRRSILSMTNFQSPLNFWRRKSQDKAIKDTTLSCKRSILNSYIPSVSFEEDSCKGLIPRIKESSVMKSSIQEPSSTASAHSISLEKSGNSSRFCQYLRDDDTYQKEKERIGTCMNDDYAVVRKSQLKQDLARKHKDSVTLCSKRRKSLSSIENHLPQKSRNPYLVQDEELEEVDPKILELRQQTMEELQKIVKKALPGASIKMVKFTEFEHASGENNSPVTPPVPRKSYFENHTRAASKRGSIQLVDSYDGKHENQIGNSGIENDENRNNELPNGFDQTGEEDQMKLVKKRYRMRNLSENTDSAAGSSNVESTKLKREPTDSITETPLQKRLPNEILNSTSEMSPSSGRSSPIGAALRKASITSHKILKKMRSSTTLDKVNMSGMIVDEDSLIGLSEEELVARIIRMRSLRKVVGDRIKSERNSADHSVKFEE